LFINPFIQKSLIAKDDLVGEIWVNFQLLQNPNSEHTALSMVVYLKFLSQLNFIGVQTQVPTQTKFAKKFSRESSFATVLKFLNMIDLLHLDPIRN